MKRILLLIGLIALIVGCNSDDYETVVPYDQRVAPPANCQDEALFNAVYIERVGYEALIVHGKLNGTWHVQTKFFDGARWRWLIFTGGKPLAVDVINGWGEFIAEHGKYEFLNKIDQWSIKNNYYEREQTK